MNDTTKNRTRLAALLVSLLALALAAATQGCVGDGGDIHDLDLGSDATPSDDTTATTPDTSSATAADTGTVDTTTTDTAASDTTPDDTTDTASADTADTTAADTSGGDTTLEDTRPEDTAPDVSTCEAGTEDCDGDPSNGCESLDSLEHCGACGNGCSLANATAVCDAGACTLVACAENTDDCDADPSNGCEEDFGPAGGACCQAGAVQLDLAGYQTRWADQGTWAIYKNGGALAESLHCPAEWDTDQVADALAPANRPVDLVWRRNCPDGDNDSLPALAMSGAIADGGIIVSDGAFGEIYRIYGQFQVVSYVLLPNTPTCTEAEQVTLRLF